jgi:hypothetical protein
MGLIRCAETSVTNYQSVLLKIPEEQKFRLRRSCKQVFYYIASQNPEKLPFVSSYPSARLSACVSANLTGRIFVKFGIGDCYEYLSTNSKFG